MARSEGRSRCVGGPDRSVHFITRVPNREDGFARRRRLNWRKDCGLEVRPVETFDAAESAGDVCDGRHGLAAVK